MRSAAWSLDEFQVVAGLRRRPATRRPERRRAAACAGRSRAGPRRQRPPGVGVDLEHRAAVEPRLDRPPDVALAFAGQRAHQPRDQRAPRADHVPVAGDGAGKIGEPVAQRVAAVRRGRNVARERVLRVDREARARQSQSRASSLRSSMISYISAGLSDGSTRSGTMSRARSRISCGSESPARRRP